MKNLNEKIVKILNEQNKTISFMESCTGGFLANEITNVSGASNVLKVSLVTYSNEYKMKFGVTKDTLDKYTVYSIETAKEMAKQVSDFADSSIGIGVTGEFRKWIKRR
jgi:PncC family amidohydrolase